MNTAHAKNIYDYITQQQTDYNNAKAFAQNENDEELEYRRKRFGDNFK